MLAVGHLKWLFCKSWFILLVVSFRRYPRLGWKFHCLSIVWTRREANSEYWLHLHPQMHLLRWMTGSLPSVHWMGKWALFILSHYSWILTRSLPSLIHHPPLPENKAKMHNWKNRATGKAKYIKLLLKQSIFCWWGKAEPGVEKVFFSRKAFKKY